MPTRDPGVLMSAGKRAHHSRHRAALTLWLCLVSVVAFGQEAAVDDVDPQPRVKIKAWVEKNCTTKPTQKTQECQTELMRWCKDMPNLPSDVCTLWAETKDGQ